MISNQLKNYLIDNYSDCIETVTELSKNLYSGLSSIIDDKKLFNFDSLVKKICRSDPHTSADAMYIKDNSITFIEFKGGFHDLINEETKDSSLIRCPRDNTIECNDYYNIFLEKRKKEKKILKNNLICKIIETFVFYKYELLNLIDNSNSNQNIKLYFLVVINDNLEEYENILLDSASGSKAISSGIENSNNVIKQIKQFTKRFRNKNGRYYYNDVSACRVDEFKEKLEQYISL